MKREELYKRTVDILVQAYFDNTLQHGNCYACAVGNIVAGNMGIKFCEGSRFNDDGIVLVWEGKSKKYYSLEGEDDYKTTLTSQICSINMGESNINLSKDQKKQLLSTGYNMEELAQIEDSFEQLDLNTDDKDELMFNGLMRVIDVLDEIHENTDIVTTAVTKKRFKKISI